MLAKLFGVARGLDFGLTLFHVCMFKSLMRQGLIVSWGQNVQSFKKIYVDNYFRPKEMMQVESLTFVSRQERGMYLSKMYIYGVSFQDYS